VKPEEIPRSERTLQDWAALGAYVCQAKGEKYAEVCGRPSAGWFDGLGALCETHAPRSYPGATLEGGGSVP